MEDHATSAPTDGDPEPDPVIEAYKVGIDRTLLRANLARSVAERVANLIELNRLAAEARKAAASN